jgi:hypothetical protein
MGAMWAMAGQEVSGRMLLQVSDEVGVNFHDLIALNMFE